LGVAFGSTLRQCSISSLGTPGMSAGFHAKMSRLARRKPLRVLRVRWHDRGRAGVGDTLVPKGDHLIQRRRSVANLTKSLPQNAGKTLLVKGIGTNGIVRVNLVDRWLRHLYKNRD
jgi:hypothetical protein